MYRRRVDGQCYFSLAPVDANGNAGEKAYDGAFPYLLDGESQAIFEPNRPDLKITMPQKTYRVRRDPLGDVERRKLKKITRRGSRLQPFKMNPVLIQRAVSRCETVNGRFWTRFWQWPYMQQFEVSGSIATSTYQAIQALNGGAAWPTDADTLNRAVISCLEKLSSPKHLDLGVGLAEIGETIKFLRKPLKSLTSLTNKFSQSHRDKLAKIKRRRRPTARESSQAIADTWLEYRYAFKPLVMDVTGTMIECSEKLDMDSKILRRASGRASTEKFFPVGKYDPEYPYDVARSHRKGVVNTYQSQTITAVQLYRYRPFFEDAIKLASLGLSPTQLPSLLWETLRFSFIADWAVDVGSWLRAWELRPWIDYLDACTSTVTKTRVNITECEIGFFDYVKCPNGSVEVTQLNRILVSLQPPSVPIVSKSALNIVRSLDSLSLLWKPTTQLLQSFSKRK